MLQLILSDIQLLLCHFYVSECQHNLYVFGHPEQTNFCAQQSPVSLGFYLYLPALCTHFLDSSKFVKLKQNLLLG